MAIFLLYLLQFLLLSEAQVLRLNHLQVTGTYSSYHLAPAKATPQWAASSAPLDIQLSEQFVRHFEFDFTVNQNTQEFQVYRIKNFDDSSLCSTLVECMIPIRDWSNNHPSHGPIFIQVASLNTSITAKEWSIYESDMKSVWGSKLLTPDDVRAPGLSLRDTIQSIGWPLASTTQGKVVLFLVTGQVTYNSGNFFGLFNRTSFIALPIEHSERPEASIIGVMDPIEMEANITELVRDNFIVKTFADRTYFPYTEKRCFASIGGDYFNVADTDNNSLVSRNELKALMRLMNMNIDDGQLSLISSLCRANPDFDIYAWICALQTLKDGGATLWGNITTLEQASAQRDSAWNSGAHLISTSFPSPPHQGADQNSSYWSQTPGGYVYRCNPIFQGISCSNSDFENTQNTFTYFPANEITYDIDNDPLCNPPSTTGGYVDNGGDGGGSGNFFNVNFPSDFNLPSLQTFIVVGGLIGGTCAVCTIGCIAACIILRRQKMKGKKEKKKEESLQKFYDI